MARRPLYPVTPGETAVDRLLNQTLPNILKEERARQEREELREEEKNRYAAEFKYRVGRDTKIDNDNFRKEDNQYGIDITRALENNNFTTAKALFSARETLYNENPNFVTDGMKEFSISQQNSIDTGIDVTSSFKSNNEIIRSDASPLQKLKAYQYNEKNIDKVNVSLGGKFRDSISNTKDASLIYIQNEKSLLGLLQGFGTNFNTLTSTADKMESTGFESLTEKELESLVPQLSAEDQKEYSFPSSDPVKNGIRQRKLEAIYKKNQIPVFNQTGKKVIDDLILSAGGVDSFRQIIKNTRDENLGTVEDITLENLSKAADFATRGRAERIKADAEGKTGQYIQGYLKEQYGFDVNYLFQTERKSKTIVKEIPGRFKDRFSELSDREIVKEVMDPNNNNAFLSDKEQYILFKNTRYEELKSKRSAKEILTASEKNELNSLKTELQPYVKEINLLTDERYLRRRAEGKKTFRGSGGKASLKGTLNLVESVEKMESSKEMLQGAIETSLQIPQRPFGEGYVIPEKLQLSEEQFSAYKDAHRLVYGKPKAKLTRQVSKSEIEKLLAVLDKRILQTDNKISKEVVNVKGAYDLFSNKVLTEIVNTSEDGTQDISYLLLDN